MGHPVHIVKTIQRCSMFYHISSQSNGRCRYWQIFDDRLIDMHWIFSDFVDAMQVWLGLRCIAGNTASSGGTCNATTMHNNQLQRDCSDSVPISSLLTHWRCYPHLCVHWNSKCCNISIKNNKSALPAAPQTWASIKKWLNSNLSWLKSVKYFPPDTTQLIRVQHCVTLLSTQAAALTHHLSDVSRVLQHSMSRSQFQMDRPC